MHTFEKTVDEGVGRWRGRRRYFWKGKGGVSSYVANIGRWGPL